MGTDLAISSPLADLTDTFSFTNVKSLAWTLIVSVALIQFTCNTNLLLVFEHYLTIKSTIPGSRSPTHDTGYIRPHRPIPVAVEGGTIREWCWKESFEITNTEVQWEVHQTF